MVKPSYHL